MPAADIMVQLQKLSICAIYQIMAPLSRSRSLAGGLNHFTARRKETLGGLSYGDMRHHNQYFGEFTFRLYWPAFRRLQA